MPLSTGPKRLVKDANARKIGKAILAIKLGRESFNFQTLLFTIFCVITKMLEKILRLLQLRNQLLFEMHV